jgi:hypothetical protein
VPEVVIVTSSVNQPFEPLVPVALSKAVGPVLSILIPVFVLDAVFPALSVHVPVADWFKPSVDMDWLIGGVPTPEVASEQNQETVTSVLFQPAALAGGFWVGEPMVGGVESIFTITSRLEFAGAVAAAQEIVCCPSPDTVMVMVADFSDPVRVADTGVPPSRVQVKVVRALFGSDAVIVPVASVLYQLIEKVCVISGPTGFANTRMGIPILTVKTTSATMILMIASFDFSMTSSACVLHCTMHV